MAYTKQDTEDLEAQVARIRAKRNGGFDKDKLRKVLNTLFLIGAAIGVVVYLYFTYKGDQDGRIYGLIIVGVSMIIKVAEFIIRMMY